MLLVGCASKNEECTLLCDDINVLVGETIKIDPSSNVKNAKYSYELKEGTSITLNNDSVYAKELGTSIVTIKVKGYSNTLDIRVRVCDEGLTIFGENKLVIENETELELVRFGVGEEDKIVWRSSNSEVAHVVKGKVTGVGLGNVTITAKSDVYQATFDLEVIRPTATVLEVEDSLKLDCDGTYEIKYNVEPFYALKDIKLESDNNAIRINNDNTITALSTGNCVLKVTSLSNQELVKEINVSVLSKEAPVFTKNSSYEEVLTINYGQQSKILEGLSVNDNADGDVKDNVTFNKELLYAYGERTVVLTAKDKAGNESTFERIVNVVWGYHTKFIGHSGSYYGVPNTEEAFLYAARDLHYQALECDLQMTKDLVYVTNHDSTLNDLVISNTNYEDLVKIEQTLTNGGLPKELGLSKVDKYTGHICTLERYLEICKEYGCEAIIEIKGSAPGLTSYSQERVPDLIEFVKKCGMYDDTIFLTSTKSVLTAIRKIDKTIRCQYLVNSADSQEVLDFCIENNFDLSTNVTYGGSNTKEWLDKYHEAGLEISVWTFSRYNSYKDVQEWIDKGVEYVTCDWHVMSELDLK